MMKFLLIFIIILVIGIIRFGVDSVLDNILWALIIAVTLRLIGEITGWRWLGGDG